MSTPKKILCLMLFAVLAVGLVFFIQQYFSLQGRLRAAEKIVREQQLNQKVLSFSKLFVANVLQGGETVSFDQRLQLENAVRSINDAKIYAAWQNFTNAKDQAEIQQNFYTLFNLLLEKLSF